MTSIFENTHSKVTVHILHDDTLTQDNRQKFIRTAEKYSQGLELHDVTEYMNKIGRKITDKFSRNFTAGAFFRLAIQDVIPQDRVIYLDCDIVVNMDIKELWNIDAGNNYAAAVSNGNAGRTNPFSPSEIKCRINGYKSSSYFNSGVLLMNLAEIRRRGDFFTQSVEWLKFHPHTSDLPDQDLLNSIFYGRVKLIDGRFNRSRRLDDDLSGKIIHMVWNKPWVVFGDSKTNRMYWAMFLKSAWGENITSPHEAIMTVSAMAAKAKYFHNDPKKCVMRVFRAIMYVLRLNWPAPVKSVKYIVLEIWYRLRRKVVRGVQYSAKFPERI